MYGESYSRNPGLIIQHNSKNASTTSLWGTDVLLRVQVPLAVNHNKRNKNEWCNSWISADSEENNVNGGDLIDIGSIIDDDVVVESQLTRRRHFCSRIEGYGDICSCIRPAPLHCNPLPS